jgi:hypothetical protein
MGSVDERNEYMFASIRAAFDDHLPLVVVYYNDDGTHVISNIDPRQQLIILDEVVAKLKDMT